MVLTDLMSVKPKRRAEEGAAMVGWTLDGCISDIGGFMMGAVEGVWGGRGRAGDDMAALRLWVWWATGFSSRSATEARFGELVGFAGVLRVFSGQWWRRGGGLLGLFTYLGGASQSSRSTSSHNGGGGGHYYQQVECLKV